MQQLKALEILKDIRSNFLDGKATINSVDLSKAIAELEAIQDIQNKYMGLSDKYSDLADKYVTLQTAKTCATCKNKLLCEMAQKAKDMFGTKLYEQWFNCYESEVTNATT